MSRRLLIQRGLVIFVLLVHGIWIANHLRWVADRRIDPWKLGGYGMYTVPPQRLRLDVFDLSVPDRPARLRSDSYTVAGFMKNVMHNNPGRVFRCTHIKSNDLKVFFKDNPQILRTNLAIVFTEIEFTRNHVAAPQILQGRVQVQWVTPDLFVYGSQFCGDVETGEVSLS